MQRSSPHDGKTLQRAAVVVCGRITQGRQQKSAARPSERKWPAESRLNTGGSGSFPEGKPCPVRLVPPLDDRGAVRYTDRNRKICYRPEGQLHSMPSPPNTIGCSPSRPRFRIVRIFPVSHWNMPIVIPLKTLQHAALNPQSLKSFSSPVTLLPVTMLPRLSKSDKAF